MTQPFRIPTLADMTRDDRAEMLNRALKCCPDPLDDLDLVVLHLFNLGISISSVSDIIDAALDEARANRADGFVSLGDAAADVVNKIQR